MAITTSTDEAAEDGEGRLSAADEVTDQVLTVGDDEVAADHLGAAEKAMIDDLEEDVKQLTVAEGQQVVGIADEVDPVEGQDSVVGEESRWRHRLVLYDNWMPSRSPRRWKTSSPRGSALGSWRACTLSVTPLTYSWAMFRLRRQRSSTRCHRPPRRHPRHDVRSRHYEHLSKGGSQPSSGSTHRVEPLPSFRGKGWSSRPGASPAGVVTLTPIRRSRRGSVPVPWVRRAAAIPGPTSVVRR